MVLIAKKSIQNSSCFYHFILKYLSNFNFRSKIKNLISIRFAF